MRKNRIDKYRALFTTAVYEPTYIAKRTFGDEGARAAIRYVKVPLTTVPDNEVKVTDDDIKAFMQKRPGYFQVDQAQRTIEYVSFEIIPASADTARALDALTTAKTEFAATKDNKSIVNNKSDEANSYSEAYVNKKSYQSRFADTILSQPVGSVYGPYYENGDYKITKVVDKKELPDSVKCRYILVRSKVNGNEMLSDMAAKQRMDSAVVAVKGGASFDSVVNKYSDDDKSKGGVSTFTLEQKSGLPKELANFLFEGKKGDSKIIRDSAANYVLYFYAEIMDQSGFSSAAQLATIAKILAPSDSTVKAIYGKANDFAGKNATAAEFDAAIKKEGLDKRVGDQIKMNTFTIPGIGPAREVVKWVYDNKVGDVSQVFQLGDQRYVVAKIAAAQEKGMREITPQVRPRLEQLVRDEKKVDIIANKYKAETTLEAIAKTTNGMVQQNDSLMLSGTTALEPRVVGFAFSSSLQPNTVSPGIKGENCVYFITVTSKTPPQTIDVNNPGFKQIMDMQRSRNEMQQQNAAAQMLQQAIVKKANVEYYYYNF